MISLSSELRRVRDGGAIGEAAAARLIALEDREVFSIYGELRFLTWAGVLLIATGVGLLIKHNLDRIGPLALATAIGIAAAACYGWAWWKRGREASLVDDYILLLGALLLSADVAFIETQFHIFGADWPRYSLMLAAIHAVAAYLFASRAMLSLSIMAIAVWLGAWHNNAFDTLDGSIETGVRALVCAAIVMAWRFADRRQRPQTAFTRTFDHFATNFAFLGAFLLMFHDDTRLTGVVLALAFAVAALLYGYRVTSEAFVLYGYIYGLIAIDVLVISWVKLEIFLTFYFAFSKVGALIGLLLIHLNFRARRQRA